MPYKDPAQQRAYQVTWRADHRDEENARSATWRATNPELAKASVAAWRAANPEQHRANLVAWRKANPEKKKAIDAVYRANNREEIKARRATHPEASRIAGTRYAARKKGLPATLTVEQWGAIQAAYKYRCAYCGKKESKKRPLTQDHVIPLSKDGGTTADNIVPACTSCNSKKRTGLPPKPVKLVLL